MRAFIQANNKDPKLILEAAGYVSEALKISREWVPVILLAGRICESQGNAEQALLFYKIAISRGERDVDVIRHTARLLVQRHHPEDLKDAKELFDSLEKQKSPLVGEMQQEYIFVKVLRCKDGDIAETGNLVEKSVAPDCKSDKELTWQGELYSILTDRLKELAKKKADAANPEAWTTDTAMLTMAQRGVNSLLKANQINPQSDGTWVALVQLLADIGQSQKAKPFIEKAEQTLKGDAAPLTIGLCWAMVNEPAKAEQKYKAAIEAFPKNCRYLRQLADLYIRSNKGSAAEPLLRKIIELQSPATLVDTCWARRNLAIILRGRDFAGFRQALALLDENIASSAATTEDKRLKVGCLVAVADRSMENLNDAIAGLEDLIKRPTPRPRIAFRWDGSTCGSAI